MNPLLLNDHKFHVRSFSLVANGLPMLVLFYDAYAMIAAEKWDPTSTNKSSHISNLSYNKNKNNTQDDGTPIGPPKPKNLPELEALLREENPGFFLPILKKKKE